MCIGGSCDYFVEIETEEQLVSILKFINDNKIKFFVIGGGSNLLFSDERFNGIIIKLSGDFYKYEISGNMIVCGSAVNLAYLSQQTAQQGLSGLEYLSGIPGTVGGAVFGNAGINLLRYTSWCCQYRRMLSSAFQNPGLPDSRYRPIFQDRRWYPENQVAQKSRCSQGLM